MCLFKFVQVISQVYQTRGRDCLCISFCERIIGSVVQQFEQRIAQERFWFGYAYLVQNSGCDINRLHNFADSSCVYFLFRQLYYQGYVLCSVVQVIAVVVFSDVTVFFPEIIIETRHT